MNNPSGAKTRAIVYIRVSTDKQGESGLGLEAQRNLCTLFAATKDVAIVEFIEDVESGGSLERPGLQRALNELQEGRANAILISNLDRLTRDTEDGLALVKEWFGGGEDSDFLLLSASESIDPRTADGEFILTIQLAMARRELRRIRERTSAALQIKKRQLAETGHKLGRPTIAQSSPEGVRLAKELRSQGLTQKQVAEEMNRRGVKPPVGAKEWHTSTVQRALAVIEMP